MRVLLISATRDDLNMRTWPLGLASVATASDQAGHSVQLLDLMGEEETGATVRRAVEAFQPEAIGISIRNIDDQRMTDTRVFLDEVREVVRTCRSLSNAPIILGGAGYSIYPASLLDHLGVEIGVQGEGEAVFPRLLDRLSHKRNLEDLPGVYLRRAESQPQREFVPDLDTLPLPDWELVPQSLAADETFWVPVQTRRGCPMECSYCSTSAIEGNLLRGRSPRAVARWMGQGVERGFRQYYFVDNTFNLPPSYAKELCREIASLAKELVFRCILYPVRMDDELASLMAEAGCKDCSLGFESGSAPILHGMNKKFHPNDVRHAAEVLARHGIGRMGFLLLGGPGETMETALDSLRFADSLHLESMKVSVGIRIYPYTRLAEVAVEEGVIAADDDLLSPRFFVTPGLDDWLRETVSEWVAARPNWLY